MLRIESFPICCGSLPRRSLSLAGSFTRGGQCLAGNIAVKRCLFQVEVCHHWFALCVTMPQLRHAMAHTATSTRRLAADLSVQSCSGRASALQRAPHRDSGACSQPPAFANAGARMMTAG
jgi:hypothetical protein